MHGSVSVHSVRRNLSQDRLRRAFNKEKKMTNNYGLRVVTVSFAAFLSILLSGQMPSLRSRATDWSNNVRASDGRSLESIARLAGQERSNTCKFNRGPRQGEYQYYPGRDPLPVGSDCQDGQGSYGVVVPDELSHTCRFTGGQRKGEMQSYPNLDPLPVGSPCHDGQGSSGYVEPDGTKKK